MPPTRKRRSRQSFLKRFIQYVKGFGATRNIFLIADTHFDHANIMRYCHRPFKNVKDMNRTLVRNWNNIVKPRDTVYFLGDWSFGRGSKPARYWIRRLHGKIISIKGSHDKKTKGVRFYSRKVIYYGGYKFLLIHNPGERPENWDGWVIHGHKHNNNTVLYPFINGKRKTINVSVELINYRPISINSLLSLNIDSITKMVKRAVPLRDGSYY